MRKKIDVRDLQMGMFIAELDRPWLETPFMFQGFRLSTNEALKKLREICRYVWIETDRGADYVPKARAAANVAMQRMQRLAREDEAMRQRVRAIAAAPTAPGRRRPYLDQTSFEEEFGLAMDIQQETRTVMDEAVEAAKRGGTVDLRAAERSVERMVDSIIRNPDALVCLSQLKEVSEYAALHSVRTCILALAFGRHLALSRDELKVLGLGALLHDIGMMKVPAEILDKEGGLSEQEFELMARHVPWGLDIVERSGGVAPGALEVIAQHHERAGGDGYPARRTERTITPAGYIGAIVDVYDAITSDRAYNAGLSAEDALKRIYEWRDKDFDARLVEDFIRCMGVFPIGSLVELSTGSVGVVITINRARRLKPKVALVLTAARTPYSQRIVTDLMEHTDGQGREIKISRVLPTGTYGINPMDHIVQL